MQAYRKADECGPVPYPDGSGRMLMSETVTGEEWAPLAELGYVVPVEQSKQADKIITLHDFMPKKPVPEALPVETESKVEAPAHFDIKEEEVKAERTAPAPEPQEIAPENNEKSQEPGGMTDGLSAHNDEGIGTHSVDSATPRSTDSEGGPVVSTPRRRGRRS